MPRFAIITPTMAGRENLLLLAMASVKAQDFSDYIHIVIGDGPCPEAQRICLGLGGHYLTTGEKKGNWGADARNIGIEQGNAEYFMFLDDDNTLLRWSLQNLHQLANENSNPPLLAQRIHYYKRWDGGWLVHPMIMPPTYACWDNLNACIRKDIIKQVRFGKSYEHDLQLIKDCMAITGTEPILTANIGGIHV